MGKSNKEEGSSPPVSSASAGALTGDETIDDLVAEHPSLRVPLMSYGVCTCCGGSLTLRDNAEARGVPLETILEDLRREIAKPA